MVKNPRVFGKLEPSESGMQLSEQKPTPRARPGGASAPGVPSTVVGRNSLSGWLLLVLYPLLLPLGTYPVPVGDITVGAEFLFALLCVATVAAEAGLGGLRLAAGNRWFLLGLGLWLGANVIGVMLYPADGMAMMVFRMVLKALLGWLVYVVLRSSGRLDFLLKAYLAGCVAAGLATVIFALEAGDLNAIREASYGGLDPNVLEVDVFRGLARAGAGNLLPVWLCLVLGMYAQKPRHRTGLFLAAFFFVLLALLALRREVLVEFVVGGIVLFWAAPRRYRLGVAVAGLVAAFGMAAFVANSESWRDRLTGETRDEFEAGTDSRTVMLLNTPAELMHAPLLGHGPGSYPVRMTPHLDVSEATAKQLGRGIAPHNSFSRAAVENGTIGLLGFSLMVAALGWRAIRCRSRNRLHLLALMVFLHVGDWLFFGDGIASNTTWYFIGVLLYFDRQLGLEATQGRVPVLRKPLATR